MDAAELTGVEVFILFMVLLGLYLFPYLVAASRSHHQRAAILVLNLFLGWTILGWVGALVWACTTPPK